MVLFLGVSQTLAPGLQLDTPPLHLALTDAFPGAAAFFGTRERTSPSVNSGGEAGNGCHGSPVRFNGDFSTEDLAPFCSSAPVSELT